MGYWIECTHGCEDGGVWAENIVDLLNKHIDEEGWFECSCKKRGYIYRSYRLPEGGNFEPVLKGAFRLGSPDHIYQPFVFLAGDEANHIIDFIWVSHYKDLRPTGGFLRHGTGPGGPPVLAKEEILEIVFQLIRKGGIGPDEVKEMLDRI